MNPEIIGLLAGLLEVLGVFYLGTRKNKVGFLIGVSCNIFWILFVIFTGSALGLLIVCPMAFVMNIKGYIRWSKDERNDQARDLHRTSDDNTSEE